MAFGAFLKAFGAEKTEDVKGGLMAAIVSWDPETASEADIRMVEDQLDELSREVARAQGNYDNEQKEADLARGKFDKYAQVARDIKGELEAREAAIREDVASRGNEDTVDARTADAIANDATATELRADLEDCLGELRTFKPEMEREAREAVEAKAWLDELTGILKDKGEQVRNRRRELEQLQGDMAKAKARAQHEKDKTERQARLAGLRADSGDTALDAMRRKVQEANEEAEAARLKGSVLKGPEAKTSRVEARLAAQAASSPAAGGGSLDDQMAALGI